MFPLVKGSARTRLNLDQDFSQRQFQSLQRTGTLIMDDRRRRPLYFDGRFLSARDLIREQNYLLTRQSDLNRAHGVGVVHGLQVNPGRNGHYLTLQAGHGITPSGELVALDQNIELPLNNIPQTQELNAFFGLSKVPGEPARTRNGLFIVALRAVEFTATPTASYPTSVDGQRTVQDGEIIEATAITLIPYEDRGGTETDPNRRRANVAREIFVNNSIEGLPVDALPLAMVLLRTGSVEWIDTWLVRREAGAQVEDILGLGFTPHAVREAQFLQFRDHMADLLAQRASGQRGRFTAASYFSALPPVGPLPISGLNTTDFSQSFFPPEMEVDLSIIPQDELMSLVEESLYLPPIDLQASADEIDATSVLILVPVTRAQLRTTVNALESLTRPLRPAAPGLIAKRKPIESLFAMRRFPFPTGPILQPGEDDETSPTDATWQELLSRLPLLYYVRRRNLHYRSEVVGVSVPVRTDEGEATESAAISDQAREMQLVTVFNAIRTAATDRANAEITNLLSSRLLRESPLLFAGAIREMEAAANENDNTLTRSQVLRVAERYNNPEIGEGVRALAEVTPELVSTQTVFRTITQSGLVPEIDLLARSAQSGQMTVRATSPTPVITQPDRITRLPGDINLGTIDTIRQPTIPIFRPIDPILQPIIPDRPILGPINPTRPRLTLPALGERLLELARGTDADALRDYIMEQLRSLR